MDAASFSDCRGIVFDFGGTLDSDGEHWLDRFCELYGRAGLRLPSSEIKRAFYHADELCCGDPQVLTMGLRPLIKHHVRLQFDALGMEDHEKQNELVEGFCAKSERFLRRNAVLLASAKQRYRLGLVSNFYGNVAKLCEEAGIADSLDVILDSSRVGVTKPNPDIFLMALGRLDLSPTKVVFVGDSYERDMIPARTLGMKTIWLMGPKPRVPSDAEPPDASISSLIELDALIS